MARNLRPKSNLSFLKPAILKPALQPKRAEKKELPGNDMPLINKQIEGLKNAIKHLEDKLEKSEKENVRKDREFQALEDDFLTVLSEIIKTKKENDFLKTQLKMEKFANECVMLPLLVNDKCPANISIITSSNSGQYLTKAPPTDVDACVGTESTGGLKVHSSVNTTFGSEAFPQLVYESGDISVGSMNDEVSDQREPIPVVATNVDACVGTDITGVIKVHSSDNINGRTEPFLPLVYEKRPADISVESMNDERPDQREAHERVPVSEEAFEGWDSLLNSRNSFASMKLWYLAINLKDMKQYIKECIKKTFQEKFILKINFETGSKFNLSNILPCLIETVQEKFKEKNLDNKEARKEIVAAFRRFRDANSKNNKI